MKKIYIFIVLAVSSYAKEASCQWNANGNHIYNTNAGFVGIGTSSPTTLLYVAKNMTEPNITVRNLGGTGGATYTMTDDASGANWKFKATLSGGFKIRDHAHSLDVIVIEPGSFANAIYIKNTGNIGIGTSVPASSALVDMNSTTKGFLPPRMTLSELQNIQNPADGLMVYSTTDQKYYIYTNGGSGWKSLWYGSGPITPDFTCGNPLTIGHQVGEVAPVNKTVTYGTWWIGPEEELCWITQNLGADHQAASPTDTTEASAGWYWQFNRIQGYKHNGVSRTPNTIFDQVIQDESNWLPENDPCTHELGPGWRLPTRTEWETYSTLVFTWNNYNDSWISPLKVHAAGELSTMGNLWKLGGEFAVGYYWSSTQQYSERGYHLETSALLCDLESHEKAYGLTVRCVRYIPY